MTKVRPGNESETGIKSRQCKSERFQFPKLLLEYMAQPLYTVSVCHGAHKSCDLKRKKKLKAAESAEVLTFETSLLQPQSFVVYEFKCFSNMYATLTSSQLGRDVLHWTLFLHQ